jgi:cyclase
MKRIIFSLLYEDGDFILSRNFSRQKIGDLNWVFNNYNLSKISIGLDELMVINVSKSDNCKEFCQILKEISKKIFIPITAGGKINNTKDVNDLLNAGADKVLINNLYFKNASECLKISKIFGKQAIVGCIDYKISENKITVFSDSGTIPLDIDFFEIIKIYLRNGVGEIVLQSIQRDGTSFGMDIDIIKIIQKANISCPVIIKGGIGKKEHALEVLRFDCIDAICTSNILNFMGNSLVNMRNFLLMNKINISHWHKLDLDFFKNKFKTF